MLLIPHVLDAALCRELIEAWEQGHEDTGVETSRGGVREDVLIAQAKRRSDRIVVDPERLKVLTATLGRVLMPQIRKVFSFRATRFEGFKIGCYSAENSGHFSPHRDNLSPATAHRRFALSLNLNDDYDGGQLRFPEFGSHLYRPALGEALLFSGSLLHEALPVTRGLRFVLISFLFGEADAKDRAGRSPHGR